MPASPMAVKASMQAHIARMSNSNLVLVGFHGDGVVCLREVVLVVELVVHDVVCGDGEEVGDRVVFGAVVLGPVVWVVLDLLEVTVCPQVVLCGTAVRAAAGGPPVPLPVAPNGPVGDGFVPTTSAPRSPRSTNHDILGWNL